MKYPKNLSVINVPKNLIYEKNLDTKRCLIFCYLFSKKSITGNYANFLLDDLISFCGYTNRRAKIDINKTLNDMETLGYIKRLNSNSMQTVYLEEEKIKDESFCSIDISEINLLSKDKGDIRLLLFLYLRINIIPAIGKPKTCYRYLKNIEDDLGISHYQLMKSLEELKLCHYMNYYIPKKSRYGDGGFKNMPCVFCEYKSEDSEKEIEWTLNLLKK